MSEFPFDAELTNLAGLWNSAEAEHRQLVGVLVDSLGDELPGMDREMVGRALVMAGTFLAVAANDLHLALHDSPLVIGLAGERLCQAAKDGAASTATAASVPAEVLAAVQPGHKLASDPPHPLTRTERWTCTVCGRAVLRNLRDVYGSATEVPCAGDSAA